MSQHPNVILALEMATDDLPMKTLRAIVSEYRKSFIAKGGDRIGETVYDDDYIQIKPDGEDYNFLVAESDYEEGWQLQTTEGNLYFFRMVTYGYGEVVGWAELDAEKQELDAWASTVAEKYHLSNHSIFVTANYW